MYYYAAIRYLHNVTKYVIEVVVIYFQSPYYMTHVTLYYKFVTLDMSHCIITVIGSSADSRTSPASIPATSHKAFEHAQTCERETRKYVVKIV